MQSIEKNLQSVKQRIAEDHTLKSCSICVWGDPANKRCKLKDIPVQHYAPYCKEYMTSDQAIEVLAKEQREQGRKKLANRYLRLDTMHFLITGSQMIMARLCKEFEEDRKKIEQIDPQEERKYLEGKKNRDALLKGLKNIKFHMQNLESEYRSCIEHYEKKIYGGDDDYDYKESDKGLANAGFLTGVMQKVVDVCLDNGENSTALWRFLTSLQGSGILSDSDCTTYFIKK